MVVTTTAQKAAGPARYRQPCVTCSARPPFRLANSRQASSQISTQRACLVSFGPDWLGKEIWVLVLCRVAPWAKCKGKRVGGGGEEKGEERRKRASLFLQKLYNCAWLFVSTSIRKGVKNSGEAGTQLQRLRDNLPSHPSSRLLGA